MEKRRKRWVGKEGVAYSMGPWRWWERSCKDRWKNHLLSQLDQLSRLYDDKCQDEDRLMRVPDATESQEAKGYILFAILFLGGPVVFSLAKQMRALPL